MSERTVFISYRRDATGRAFAGRIHDALKQRGYDAFLDVDYLGPGPWGAQINVEVPKRAHFLLVLTPDSLTRCSDPNDWVRLEYELAESSGRNIVPVLEESADINTLKTVAPPSMQSLVGLQIAKLQHARFAGDVDELIARYIPPHKAPTAGAVTSASGATGGKPRPFWRTVLAAVQSRGFHALATVLVCLTAALGLYSMDTGMPNWLPLIFAGAIKVFALLLGLPNDTVWLGEVALIILTTGAVLLFFHKNGGKPTDVGRWETGLFLLGLGGGVCGTLLFLRSQRRP